MSSSREPKHRSIFWIDIVDSTNPDRTDPDRAANRRTLYRLVRRAFRRVRLPYYSFGNRLGRHQEDRGDGGFWLLGPSVSKVRPVRALTWIASELAAHNQKAPPERRLRLRIVVASVEVHTDAHGISGTAMDHAARLLDAPEFKEWMDDPSKPGTILGVITPKSFHDEIIHHYEDLAPKQYEPLTVSVRGTGSPEAMVRRFPHTDATSDEPQAQARTFLGCIVPSLPRWLPTPPRCVRTALALGCLTVPLLAIAAPEVEQPPKCDQPPVIIRVRVSPEKEDLIRGLADRFPRQISGPNGCLRAEVNIPATDEDSARKVLEQRWLTRGPQGLDEVDVWLPDSSLEVKQVRETLTREKGQGIDLAIRGHLASSRLVLAVPAELTRELSLSGQSTTWKDVLTWPGKGVSFGRASPNSSIAGVAATVALYQAELNVANLNRSTLTGGDAAGRLHTVEQAIVREENTPNKLLCAMRASSSGDDLRRTVLLVPEKALIDYLMGNPLGEDGCGTPQRQPRLVPVYAEGGMPEFDHPFVVITRAEAPTSEPRRVMIQQFLTHLQQAGPSFQGQGYRDSGTGTTDTSLGDIPFTVEPLELSTRYQEADLMAAWNQARKSARVLFAVDVSEQMGAPFLNAGGTRVRAAADAIDRVREVMGPRDQIGLWRFATGAGSRSLVSVGLPDPSRKAALAGQLRGLVATNGRSDLYATARAALQEMREGQAGSEPPDETTRAVIMIADGGDNGSGAGEASALADEIKVGERVRLYVLAFRPESCATRLGNIARDADGACYQIDGQAGMQRALDGITAGLWGANAPQ